MSRSLLEARGGGGVGRGRRRSREREPRSRGVEAGGEKAVCSLRPCVGRGCVLGGGPL